MISSRNGRFKGQVAIITGGSSGIGRATCLSLAKEGADIVVVGRNAARVTEAIKEIERETNGAAALGLVLDVRKEQDMEEMARRTLDRFGRVDILIASAGIARGSSSKRVLPYPVAQMPTQEWDEVLDTNLKGVFLSNRAVLPSMIRQRKGSIINISSAHGGQHGYPYASAYCASKFGVVGFSESLAEEVKQFGIKVQVVLPGATETPILGKGDTAVGFGRSLPPVRIGEFIIYLLTLPSDTVLINPVIAPLQSRHRKVPRRTGGDRTV